MARSVLLIGLSGAGKTTVARHVARMLDCDWCDLDARVAEIAGKSITEIFAEEGDAGFRVREQSALEEQLTLEPQVIATGAGWAAQPGALESVVGRALVIHLEVDPAVAARRLTGARDRPLLAGDAEAVLRDQAAARMPWYNRADLVIAASAGMPETIAAGVVSAARQYGGWASR